MPRARGRYEKPGEGEEERSSEVKPRTFGRPRRGYEHFVDEGGEEVGSDGEDEAAEASDGAPRSPGAKDGRIELPLDRSPAGDDDVVLQEQTPTPGQAKRKLTCAVVLLTLNAALGGFLFGYDTGVVSGAMLQIRTARMGLGDLSPAAQELIVSSTVGAAVVGSLLSGELQKRLWFGRKAMIVIGSFLFAGGAVEMGLAWSVASLTLGRTVVGIAVGIVSHAVPLYISECVPGYLRGRLNTVNSVFIVFGQVISSLVCCGIARGRVYQGWRWMLGLGALPALFMGLGFLWLPESPRYTLLRGAGDEASQVKAEKVLTKLRGRTNPGAVQEEMEAALGALKANQSTSRSVWKLLAPRGVRSALWLGVSLQLLQQLAGVNTLMYYSATILQMSSAGGKDVCPSAEAADVIAGAEPAVDVVPDDLEGVTEICMTALVALSQLVGTFAGMFLVDRCGRRPLLLGSLAGVVISLFLLGLSFHRGGLEMEGAPLMAMVLYLVFFGAGMAPLPWVVNAEIYPIQARSLCIGLATAANWVANFVVAATFMDLSELLSFDRACPAAHPDGAFWLYAAISGLGFIALFVKMPETRGLTLEQISDLFAGKQDPREAVIAE